MTVRELQELLSRFPGDVEIYVSTECHGCFEPARSLWMDKRDLPDWKLLLVVDSASRKTNDQRPRRRR